MYMHAKRSCSSRQSSVHYGNNNITQHAQKCQSLPNVKLDTIRKKEKKSIFCAFARLIYSESGTD